MVNLSKRKMPHLQKKWRESGATGTWETALDPKVRVSESKQLSTYESAQTQTRFNRFYDLKGDQRYTGDADKVMLVWNSNQAVPAECYRKAWFPNLKTDLVVCENPNIQRKQIGEERSLIYHFS